LESVGSSRREESGPPTKPSIAPRAAAGLHRDVQAAPSDLSFARWEGAPTRTYSRVLVPAGATLGLAGLVTAALGRAGAFAVVVTLVGLGFILVSVAQSVLLFRSFVARIDAMAREAQHKARALPDAAPAERPSDPLALLALSVGKMSDRIETLTREIEQRGEEERARVDALVRERTRQLSEEVADLRRLLGPAKAFLSVDARGNIIGHTSSVVEGWLGPPLEHGQFWDYLDRGGAEVASRFEAAWRDMLRSVPSEIDLRRMPKSLAIGDRYLALEYQAVQASDGQLERLIVVMTDITAGAAEPRTRG
jgi:hypothetical protein